jgi:hypothetical protein
MSAVSTPDLTNPVDTDRSALALLEGADDLDLRGDALGALGATV